MLCLVSTTASIATKSAACPETPSVTLCKIKLFLLLDKSLNLEVGSLLGRDKNQLANDLNHLFLKFNRVLFSCLISTQLSCYKITQNTCILSIQRIQLYLQFLFYSDALIGVVVSRSHARLQALPVLVPFQL